MGWIAKLLGKAPVKAALPRIVSTSNGYPRSVVGESHYQPALLALCGGYTPDGHAIPCEAVLRPEPDNAYDANAVQVIIEGSVVGYLERADAKRFAAEMERAGRAGEAARCGAIIKGGFKISSKENAAFGVYLAFPGRGRFSFT